MQLTTNRYRANLALVALIATSLLITGCEKLGLSLSPQDEFLESMQGRWSRDEQAIVFDKVGEQLIGLDDTGSVVILTPTGKFDDTNSHLPVKVTMYLKKNEVATSVAIAEKVFQCTENCDNPMVQMLLSGAVDKFKGILGSAVAFSGKKPVEASYMAFLAMVDDATQLKAKLQVVKTGMTSPDVTAQGVLRNASKKQDESRLAITFDNGNDLEWSFVREINDGEKQAIQAYQQKVTGITSQATATIDALIVLADKDIQSAANRSGAESSHSAESRVGEVPQENTATTPAESESSTTSSQKN